jgi:regulator of ribonuclease activity A
MEIVTADLFDRYHEQLEICDLQFRSFGRQPTVSGPCSTLSTFEDHTPVLQALSEPGDGRVLVVDAGGSLRVGVMGDRLAAIGATNGWAGMIINGAIRDSAGIDQLDLAVKALGTTARRGWTPSAGSRDTVLQFGGAVFRVGHWIYADRDCVIVSPQPLNLSSPQPFSE